MVTFGSAKFAKLPRTTTVVIFLAHLLLLLQLPHCTLGSEVQEQSKQQSQHPLDTYNFLVGIARIGARYEKQTQCGHELELLLEAIENEELWGLKGKLVEMLNGKSPPLHCHQLNEAIKRFGFVIDAFGAAPRSFLWGNHFWFASQDLCDDLNEPYSISFSFANKRAFNVTSPFPLQFSLIYAEFETPHYIDLKLPFKSYLHLGLCLPHSCNAADIFNYTNFYFRMEKFETQRFYELKVEPMSLRQPNFSWNIFTKTSSILFGSILISIVSLSIIAELLHKSKLRLKLQHKMHLKQNGNATEMDNQPSNHLKRSGKFERFLLSFRLEENYQRAISLDRKSKSEETFLSAIAGMRSIICLWVTVFHVYYYSLYAMSNAPLIFAKLEHFLLQPVMQACFYVDIFFVMSAFLLVYNFLQNESQMKLIRQNNLIANLKLYGKSLLHRYMRLTPVMIITLLLSDIVYNFLNMYSPFRLGVNSGIYCKSNWWYNLLYIHNLLDMQEICCSWTWYLACEMQFFVLFTALLFSYAKHPRRTKVVFISLACASVVIGWLCNHLNKITFQIDVIHGTLNELYVKPWVRVTPYIGGSIMGYLLHHLQKKKCQQTQAAQSHPSSKHWLWFFWSSCFIIYVATNFMSYWRSTPSWLVAGIMSFGKLIFSLCIGGVIILCARGRGGLLQQLFGMRVLQFLNRFCFSIYMLAPVIVIAVFGLKREATNFNEVGSGMDFLAVVTLSIASALILVLLVELPMQRISNIFIRFKGKGKDVVVQKCNGKVNNEGEP